jgi:hypothetical protein
MASRLNLQSLTRASALPRRRFLSAAIAAFVGIPLASIYAEDEQPADTSTRAREDAVSRIPLNKLNAETQRKLLSVVDRPSIFRRIPTKTIDCDTDMFLFLVRNPEVIVNIWEVMGVSNMTAERTGPYAWKGNDGAGTTCNIELVYGTEDLHVLYGEGPYEGGLLARKITGRCLLLLHSGYMHGRDARDYVGNQLDVFLTIDNAGAEFIAKTLHPLVGQSIDTNFGESAHFLSRLSAAAEKNGAGMERLADKLTHVAPEVRSRFLRTSIAVSERAAARLTSPIGGADPAPYERR